MARLPRHYVSKLFQPQNILPKNVEVQNDITSRSQKLMSDVGIIRLAGSGCYHILPLGERSLRKLNGIVDEEMSVIGAQKLILPSLVPSSLWKKTDRYDSAAPELFTLEDRHGKEFVLSPTHEEAATELISSISPISYRHLPLRLYQTTSKFRDEIRPRLGLIRGKEFLMKDLYTFDVSSEKAKETYSTVTYAYEEIFKKIGVNYVKVTGITGLMGGSLSHEFHFLANVGDDRLVVCESCGHGNNEEVFTLLSESKGKCFDGYKCSECGQKELKQIQGIEVGHTFLLGTRYSEALGAQVRLENGKPEFIHMGCYGLGITRLLAGVVECLSLEHEIRWPLALAPFKVCLIPPKEGSKESKLVPDMHNVLYDGLEEIPWLRGEVIIDDCSRQTVGKRLMDAKRVGYPLIVVFGRGVSESEPLLEINDCLSGKQVLLPLHGAIQYIAEHTKCDADCKGEIERSVYQDVTHG